MEIKQEKLYTAQGDVLPTIQSKINASKLAKAFSILSNMYSNPIESIVREYVSNAVDATTKAGTHDPVLVSLKKKGEKWYFEVEDFGTGISPDVAKNIYFNYFESDKDTNDDLIGGWGLGCKSALAYTNSFNIITRYDYKEYYYVFAIGEQGIPEGILLYEKDTAKPNGTLIQIKIQSEDNHYFHNAMEKQIVYFNNIYRTSDYSPSLSNDYNIYDYTYFKVVPHSPYNYMHILLGDVAYDIDYDILGRNVKVRMPVGVKFEISELQPTPSREEILYNDSSIKKINDKLDLAIKEIESLYLKEHEESYDPIEYFNRLEQHEAKLVIDPDKNISIPIDNHYIKKRPLKLSTFEGVNYDYSNFKLKQPTYTYSKVPSFVCKITHVRDISKSGNFITPTNTYNTLNHALYTDSYITTVIISNLVPDRTKNLYLESKYNSLKIFKNDKLALKDYIRELSLNNYPKKDWRSIIKAYQETRKAIIDHYFIDYDSIEVPKEFIDKLKEERKSRRALIKTTFKDGEISYTEIIRGTNKPYALQTARHSPNTLVKGAGKVIFCHKDDLTDGSFSRGELEKFKSLRIRIYGVSTKNLNLIKEDTKISKYENFKMNHKKLMGKIATTLVIAHLDRSFNILKHPLYTREALKLLNSDMHNKLKELNDYMGKYNSYSDPYMKYLRLSEYGKQLVKEYKDYIQKDVLDTYREIFRYITPLSLITQSMTKSYNYSLSDVKLYVTWCKYYKIPINKDWFLKDEFNRFISNQNLKYEY